MRIQSSETYQVADGDVFVSICVGQQQKGRSLVLLGK